MSALTTWMESQKKTLMFIYVLYFISHVFFITLPPKGTHVWRQCNTSAVARNFVEEDMNIFKPRVDRRRNTDGVTGMQFPSFEYTTAVLCWVSGGYFESSNRIVAFCFFGLGLFYFYRWVFLLTQSRVKSFWSTFMMLWCPILYYHSISASGCTCIDRQYCCLVSFLFVRSTTKKTPITLALVLVNTRWFDQATIFDGRHPNGHYHHSTFGEQILFSQNLFIHFRNWTRQCIDSVVMVHTRGSVD